MIKLFKALKKKYWDWLNSSDARAAELVRKRHFKKMMDRLRRSG